MMGRIALLAGLAVIMLLGTASAKPKPDPIMVDIEFFMHKTREIVPEAFLGFDLDWNNSTVDESWVGADIIDLKLGARPCPTLNRAPSHVARSMCLPCFL